MKQDKAQVELSLIRDHRDTKLVSILASPGLLHTQQPRFYVLYGNHKHQKSLPKYKKAVSLIRKEL